MSSPMSLSSRSPVFVASSFEPANPDHFAGIAYTEDAIIIGQEGLARYLEAHDADTFCRSVIDGRFHVFVETPQAYRAFTDPLVQDTLFYYTSKEAGQPETQWAVSNSLLGLAEYLQDKVKLMAYRPALMSFFINGGSGIGAQPVSNRTVFAEIRVLPVGKTLVVDKQRQSVHFEGSPKDITRPFEEMSYEELVVAALSEGASRLRALHEQGVRLASDLTGGQDSRACFGLLSYALKDWKKVRLISNPRKKDDYRIARSLVKRYGGKLHSNSGRRVSITAETAYRYWKQGSIGAYLPVYFPSSVTSSSHEFKLNGGLILAKQFADLDPDQFAESLASTYANPADYQAVSREFFSILDDLELDRHNPHAMDWYYMAARARYHYGRSWYSSLAFPILSPLINPKLFTASLRLNREQLDNSKLSLDILMAMDPVLALHPFDNDEKSFDAALIRDSPFWKTSKKAFKISSGQAYQIFSGSLEPLDGAFEANKHHPHDQCLQSIEQELMRLSQNSTLVNEVFSKAALQHALKELRADKKLSNRSRLAAHVITCGVVESLIS